MYYNIVKCRFPPKLLSLALNSTELKPTGRQRNVLPTVMCHCDIPATIVDVPESASWKLLEISVLLEKISALSDSDQVCFDELTDKDLLCVDAGGDVESQVLGAICFNMPIVYAPHCLKCALEFCTKEGGQMSHRWDKARGSYVLVNALE